MAEEEDTLVEVKGVAETQDEGSKEQGSKAGGDKEVGGKGRGKRGKGKSEIENLNASTAPPDATRRHKKEANENRRDRSNLRDL